VGGWKSIELSKIRTGGLNRGEPPQNPSEVERNELLGRDGGGGKKITWRVGRKVGVRRKKRKFKKGNSAQLEKKLLAGGLEKHRKKTFARVGHCGVLKGAFKRKRKGGGSPACDCPSWKKNSRKGRGPVKRGPPNRVFETRPW